MASRPFYAGDAAADQPASFFFSSSLTAAGLALPPEAFMVWPTKNPNSLSLPERYSATLSALAAITSSITFSMAPVSKRRSEEHTSELQSLMRISYAVFCLKKKKQQQRLLCVHIPPASIHQRHTA